MKQQTAVNWILIALQNKFYKETGNMYNSNQFLFESLFEQAKAMEKEQIVNAHNSGKNILPPNENGEQYYNETYNK